MKASWQEWMTGDRALTKAGNLKQSRCLSTAWKSITVETLVHLFLVCGLANDDLVSNDVPSVEAMMSTRLIVLALS